MQTRHLVIFWFVVAVGVLLRLILLGSVPVSLYMDEAAIGVDAYTISQTGKDMHGASAFQAIIPSYGDFKMPVYIWFSTMATMLFGANPVAVRIPSALAGIASIFLAYAFMRELFSFRSAWLNRWAPVVASALVAILPWSLLFSRTGFEGHLGQAILGLSILLWLKAQKDTSLRGWVLSIFSAVIAALAVYTYYSIRFVVPAVILTSFFLHAKPIHLQLGRIVGWLFIWIILFIPMYQSPYYEPSQRFRLSAQSILQDMPEYVAQQNLLREQAGNTLLSHLIYHRYWFLIQALANNYTEQFSLPFLFLTGDSNLRHSTNRVGLSYVISIPFVLLGLVVAVQKQWRVSMFLLVWILFSALPAAVPHEVPHALRFLNALLPFSLVLSLGVVEFFHHAIKLPFFQRYCVLSVFAILVLGSLAWFQYDYWIQYPSRSADAWDDGVAELVTAAAQESISSPDQTIVIAGNEKAFLWYILYAKPAVALIQAEQSMNFRKEKLGSVYFGADAVQRYLNTPGSTVFGTTEELNYEGEIIPMRYQTHYAKVFIPPKESESTASQTKHLNEVR